MLIRSSLPRRRRRLDRYIRHPASVLLFMVVLILCLAYAGLFAVAKVRVAQPISVRSLGAANKAEPVVILVALTDQGSGLSASEVVKARTTGDGSGPWLVRAVWILVDSKAGKVVVVSIPPRLRVRGTDGGYAHLGAIYSEDRSEAVGSVATVTGMPVHHLVEVRLDRATSLLDALGGVEAVPPGDPSCRSMDGQEALKPIRVSGAGDEYERAAFTTDVAIKGMKALAKRRSVADPLRALRLTSLLSRSIRLNQKLDPLQMRGVAQGALGLLQDEPVVRILPTYSQQSSKSTFDVFNPRQTASLFAALKAGGELPGFGSPGVSPIDPGEIPLTVLNGTDTPELAKKQAVRLAALGFPPPAGEPEISTGNAVPHRATVVYHDVGAEQRASLVAEMYKAEIKPFPQGMSSRTEVMLIIGEDLAKGELVPTEPGLSQQKKAKNRPNCGEG